MSVSRTVSHLGFRLELSIIHLDDLFPHEETIPESVSRLKQSLVGDRVQRDPIIVDTKTFTILDGMHRHKALLELGAKRGVVCRVDYSDSRVKVRRWLRSARVEERKFVEMSRKLGMVPARGKEDAVRLVDTRASCAALLYRQRAMISQISGGPFESFDLVRAFDSYCRNSTTQVSLQTDDDNFPPDEDSVTLYLPLPQKDEVVKAASLKKLFPPKSTRHLIPARPLGVGIPLESLTDDSSTAEARVISELDRILQTVSPKRLGPGASYMGRRYEETIYVYEA